MKTWKGWTPLFVAVCLCTPPLSAAVGDDAADRQQTQLMSGSYSAALSPAVDADAARNIQDELEKIDELEKVEVNASDSRLRFSVKDNEQINVTRLSDAIKKAAPEVTLYPPEPETSGDNSRPGSQSPQSPQGY